LLPQEVMAQRAMAAPWIFNAINNTLKTTNMSGAQIGKGTKDKQSMWDTLFSDEEKKALDLYTIKDNEVLFNEKMGKTLGIARYPATLQSAQMATNILAQDTERVKTIKAKMQKMGID